MRIALLLLPLAASAAAPAVAAPCARQWVAGWASAQMAPTGENRLPPDMLEDSTLRQIIRSSIAGGRVRVRLSNVAGSRSLHLHGATLSRALAAKGSAIDAKSLLPLRFDGQADVTIPPGADYLSDPVSLPVQPFDNLTVSIHFDEGASGQTSHPGSRATSWLLKGDHLGDAAMAGATAVEHWFSLSALEVETCKPSAAIVALGDSITDGRGATTDGNDRWTDNLARRLQADSRTRHLSIINQGIGGNRLLDDGLGPNALARLDRDVLAQPGVRYLILLEGINDIGTLTREAPVSDAQHARLVSRMIGAYRQIIARARGKGIKVIGATIMPFMGSAYYHPDARNEADRQAVNQWIRQPGNFDAVIDFDRLMRDPARPDHLRPRFDVGDSLHPSPEGYRAMGEAIPLDLFR
ncbi:SGNH/GDSL hydrolase family protein [Sphingobium sp. Sx8-8]|uniref:SGNH/GDSL hydrolase family protein n=1 Tax=Sphingobium sp. Sx8-8 TaxID=2933617 RepID=UPI001F57A80C|nr:SGNH/GDSL hydrolase family protein [Sphingobium sp. Sx8-8]